MAVLALLATPACLRQDGRNSACRWPAEAPVHEPTPAHLSADAEFAEDLAIRYADVHHGLRTGHYVSDAVYAAERDRCMNALFAEAAAQHHVPAAEIAAALGRNRGPIDAAENLPFALAYAFAAWFAARMIWRRYPPASHGWIAGAVMAGVVALLMAAGALLLGETWGMIAETWRTGNGHMSYRAFRLWLPNHRPATFAAGLVVSILTAWLASRRPVPSDASAGPSRPGTLGL